MEDEKTPPGGSQFIRPAEMPGWFYHYARGTTEFRAILMDRLDKLDANYAGANKRILSLEQRCRALEFRVTQLEKHGTTSKL